VVSGQLSDDEIILLTIFFGAIALVVMSP